MATMPSGAWTAARLAADRLVAGTAAASVVRGVLAQWIAENGWTWPPPRRNPGNLARGWAAVFSYPYSIQTPNPQPGNPIVTFATVAGGASCYADGLRTFARYADALSKARAGDGLGFALAVCAAGYGTNATTTRNVYAALGGEPSSAPSANAGGANVAIRYCPVTATATKMQLRGGQPAYDRPGGTAVTHMAHDAAVPYVGLAGSVNGTSWRAVVIGTRWSYPDGHARPTVLYVPADAGQGVPG